MMEISRIMEVGRLRVTLFFNAWEKATDLYEKEKTLGIKKGRGAKLKLEKVKDILPDLVKENSRNLNVVLSILDQKYDVKITIAEIANLLKKCFFTNYKRRGKDWKQKADELNLRYQKKSIKLFLILNKILFLCFYNHPDVNNTNIKVFSESYRKSD